MTGPEPRDPGDTSWRSWFASTAPLPAVPGPVSPRRLAWALGATGAAAAAGLYAWAWFAPAAAPVARPAAVVDVPAPAVTVTSRAPAEVVTVPGIPVPSPGMTVPGASVTRFVTRLSRPQPPETVTRAPVRAANVPVSVVTRTVPATPRPPETVTATVPGPTETVTETAPGPTETVTATVPGPTETVTETPAPSGQAAG